MTVNDLSHLGTLSFHEGMLGFNLRKRDGEYRIGDLLLFHPCINIYKYSVSETNERFLKHILYDIYEFTFIAVDKYEHHGEGEDGKPYKDRYHYLIEVLPGFNVFHFNWPKKADEYIKMNTLYRGYGGLSNCEDPSIYNPKIDPEAMERIRCKGILEKLQINGLWRDHDINGPLEENTYDDDDCRVISYDDILRSFGYPEDMVKFRVNSAKYVADQSSLESTAQNKNSDTLVYSIRMA